MNSRMSRSILRITLIVAMAMSLTQCNKRAKLKAEIEQKNQQLQEFKLKQKQIQDAINATGNLGRYNATQEKHLEELKGQITITTSEIQRFKDQKESLIKEIESIRSDIDQHRAKFR